MNFVYPGQRPKIPSLCHYSLQWRIQGRGPPPLPPLFLDQTVAVRAEKKTAPLPYLYVWIRHSSLYETNAALNN